MSSNSELDEHRLGPFRLRSQLDEGSTAIVWDAELCEARAWGESGKRCALKIFHDEEGEDTSSVARRFATEAALGRQAAHSSLTRVHESGVSDVAGRTRRWIAFERIEGKSLRRVIEHARRGLPEPLVRHVGARIAEALASLHDAGIVHRDIKPENVLMTPAREIKVIDLGAAWIGGTDAGEEPDAFVGSPAYAAPEQLVGGSTQPSSDLHSLGVVLLELVTGITPPSSLGAEEALRRRRESVDRLVAAATGTSNFLVTVIRGLLASHPKGRIGPATLVAELLDRGEDHPWWKTARSIVPARDLPGALGAAHSLATARFAGRGDILDTFADEIEQVRRGTARGIFVSGEAGLGKTRLVAEALADSGLDVVAVELGVARSGSAVLSAIDRRFPARAELADLLDRHSQRALRTLLDGDETSEEGPGVVELGRRLALAMARRGPTAWVFEDLHESPDAAREVALLLAAARSARLLVVVTSRAPPPAELNAAAANGTLRHERLVRLSADATSALVRDLLAGMVSERVATRIGALADGHPMVAIALTRDLDARGELVRDDAGRVRALRPDAATPSAKTLQAVVRASVASLRRADRAVLEAAAVHGDPFDARIVATALRRPLLEALDRLARLQRSGMVRSEGRTFLFAHPSQREAVLAEISSGRAARLHAATARAIEVTTEGGSSPERAVKLAEHWLEAGDFEAARHHLHDALGRLNTTGQSVTCLRLVDRALRLLPEAENEERAHLLITRVQAIRRIEASPSREKIEHDIDEARTAALAVGNVESALRADRELACLARDLGEYEEAHHIMTRVTRAAEEHGFSRLALHARKTLATALFALGRLEEAGRAFERARDEAAALGLKLALSHLEGNIGVVASRLGRHERADAHFRRQLTIARDVGDTWGEGRVVANLVTLALRRGDPAGACEWLAQQEHLGDRTHDPFVLGNVEVRRADVHLLRGDMTAVLASCDDALFNPLITAQPTLLEAVQIVRAVALACLGNVTGATAELTELDRSKGATMESVGRSRMAIAMAELSRQAGHIDETRAWAAEAMRAAERSGKWEAGLVARCLAAECGDGDPAAIEVPETTEAWFRLQAHAILTRAGATDEHRERGRALLTQLTRDLEAPEARHHLRTHHLWARELLR